MPAKKVVYLLGAGSTIAEAMYAGIPKEEGPSLTRDQYDRKERGPTLTQEAPAPPGASYPTEGEVPPTWQVGDLILDLYEVKEVYTSGGMGLVYRVHHRGWDLDLAVKSPRPEALEKAGGAEDFTREAEA